MNNEARLYGKACEEMVKFWPRVGSIYWDFPFFFNLFFKKKYFYGEDMNIYFNV